jgi:hypothetical protein
MFVNAAERSGKRQILRVSLPHHPQLDLRHVAPDLRPLRARH